MTTGWFLSCRFGAVTALGFSVLAGLIVTLFR